MRRKRPRRFSCDVTFEVGSTEYTVEVIAFDPPTPATRDDPGDGGEVSDVSNIVRTRLYHDGETTPGRPPTEDVVTWETFMREYAAFHRLDLSSAQDRVDAAMYTMGLETAMDYEPDCDYRHDD